MGLTIIAFTGIDLLTSNMMYSTLPFLSHPDKNEQHMASLTKVLSVYEGYFSE